MAKIKLTALTSKGVYQTTLSPSVCACVCACVRACVRARVIGRSLYSVLEGNLLTKFNFTVAMCL